jgi:hypothetical protein
LVTTIQKMIHCLAFSTYDWSGVSFIKLFMVVMITNV